MIESSDVVDYLHYINNLHTPKVHLPSQNLRIHNYLFIKQITMKKTILIILIFLTPLWVIAQITVTGTITDEDRQTLPGVSILIKGTHVGTITDFNGSYSIEIPNKEAVLIFSFIGFVTQEIRVGEQRIINISLKSDSESLDEVIVVGYGQTQNKRTISTAISKIESKHLEKLPVTRTEEALQGTTPGVIIMQQSGSPGAPLTSRIRGIGTAGHSTPLIIVDGVQVPDMRFINSNDIKNITVLKDAASAAIYGSRGGNGVLLIETKQGRRNLEKPAFEITAYTGVQMLANTGDYLNSQQYADYYNKSIDYLKWIGDTKIQSNQRGKFTQDEINKLPDSKWIEEITQNAPITDVYFNYKDGSKRSSFLFSGGFLNQEGIIGGSKTGFKRGSIRFSSESDLSSRLKLKMNTLYTITDRNFITENDENNAMMVNVGSMPSIYPAYASAGIPYNTGKTNGREYNGVSLNQQRGIDNPLIDLNFADNDTKTHTLYGQADLEYYIFRSLKFNTNYSYLHQSGLSRFFEARYNFPEQELTRDDNTYREESTKTSYSQWEGYFSYNPHLSNAHTLNIISGSSVLVNQSFYSERSGQNFIGNTIDDVNFGNVISDDKNVINNDEAFKNTTISFYGRANYNYNEKYLLGFTFRADGSSKFGEDYKWGYFPSVSGGWVISEENFLNGGNTLSLLKLRASWGINGNDHIAPYQHIPRYRKSPGVLSLLDYNKDVRWEEVTQTNIGLDANLFNNRLGITLDHYIKETKDMLLDFPNPGLLGLESPVRNAATVENKGTEVMMMYKNKFDSGFTFNIGTNISFNKNNVKDLGGGLPIQSAGTRIFHGAPNISRTDVGHPIASFYGYKFDGINDKGNIKHKDLNKDGSVDASNDQTYIGNPYPDITYGLTLGVEFKGFDLYTLIQGIYGNEVVNASSRYDFALTNRTTRFLNGWMPDNPNNKVARPSALEATNYAFSDYYLEDGSYTRIRNITLGYSLPKRILSQLRLQSLRFYLSAHNVFTFSNYSGLDPEIGSNNNDPTGTSVTGGYGGNPLDVGIDRGFYPLARTFMGGVQLTF